MGLSIKIFSKRKICKYKMLKTYKIKFKLESVSSVFFNFIFQLAYSDNSLDMYSVLWTSPAPLWGWTYSLTPFSYPLFKVFGRFHYVLCIILQSSSSLF
jgi:hypothetical protein